MGGSSFCRRLPAWMSMSIMGAVASQHGAVCRVHGEWTSASSVNEALWPCMELCPEGSRGPCRLTLMA